MSKKWNASSLKSKGNWNLNNMIIDHTPVIRAFVEERIKSNHRNPVHGAVIEELELLLKLIESLENQGKFFETEFAKCLHPK